MRRYAGIPVLLAYLIAAFVNLAPLVGVVSAERINSLYGLEVAAADLSLLMRHRGILFGIVWALLLIVVPRKSMRVLAGTAGLVSMFSYLVLIVSIAPENSNLIRIAWTDAVATAVLIPAFIAELADSHRRFG